MYVGETCTGCIKYACILGCKNAITFFDVINFVDKGIVLSVLHFKCITYEIIQFISRLTYSINIIVIFQLAMCNLR